LPVENGVANEFGDEEGMFKIDISDLDKLQRELQEAQAAFAALDGEIAILKFDPDDRVSVESAIHQMETAIDRKIEPYRNNPMVATMTAKLKQSYSDAIWQKATVVRPSHNEI
jgi:hypothetical protein